MIKRLYRTNTKDIHTALLNSSFNDYQVYVNKFKNINPNNNNEIELGIKELNIYREIYRNNVKTYNLNYPDIK